MAHTRHLLILLTLAFASPAQAELVLGISSDNGASFATDFDVQVGESLNFEIYLQQSGAETILNTEGLVSWGFDLTRTSTSVGTIASASANPVFDFANHNVTTPTGFEWEYADSSGFGVTGNNILLGSFQYQAIAEGGSVFTLEDRLIGTTPGDANWFTPVFTELDQQLFAGANSSYQFNVNSTTAVPEPSSLALLACVAGVAVLRRRRRKCVKIDSPPGTEVG
ncbi:MAG: PEP-CTERM sorting domain-containing protein [Rubripirellula sp.]